MKIITDFDDRETIHIRRYDASFHTRALSNLVIFTFNDGV